MTTWFATATGNINTAGRWNSLPGGGGTTLTWPPSPGDVLVTNSYTITVNVSVDLGAAGELRNGTTGGATAGGYFQLSNGVSVTANGYSDASGGRIIYAASTVSATLVGDYYCSIGTYGVQWSSSGTLTYTGNAYGGSVANSYVIYAGSGTVNSTGTLIGGSFSGAYAGGLAAATVVFNHTGNITGVGVYQNFASNLTVIGNVIAGSVANSAGILIAASGTCSVSGYAEAHTSNAAITNSAQGIVTVGETHSASNGRGAVLGAFRYASATAAKTLPVVAGTQKTLSVLDVAALVPAETDVKAGVVYGDGAYTGTLSGGGGSKKISMMRRI